VWAHKKPPQIKVRIPESSQNIGGHGQKYSQDTGRHTRTFPDIGVGIPEHSQDKDGHAKESSQYTDRHIRTLPRYRWAHQNPPKIFF
jgi:hypothetical protein